MKKLLVGLFILGSFSALANSSGYQNCVLTGSAEGFWTTFDKIKVITTLRLTGEKDFGSGNKTLELKNKTFSSYESNGPTTARYYQKLNKKKSALLKYAQEVCSDVVDNVKL